MNEPDTPATRLPVRPVIRLLWLLAVAAATLMLGVIGGLVWHHALDEPPRPLPETGSVDAGFAQDMTVHHAQAVDMSGAALTLSTDPVVRSLAYDVLTTQQAQIGTMQGWLTMWRLPAQSTDGYMAWMPMTQMWHGAGTSTMPGMATPAELQRLRELSGPDFDGYYLQLLLRHHEGGLEMARSAVDNASVREVSALAERIVATQSAEAAAIRDMLAAKGLAPLPG